MLPLPLAVWLMSSIAPGTSAELPGGGSAEFRARMMGWSAAERVAAPLTRVPHERAGALPRLSSGFGHRSDPIHGARAMHSGLDMPGAPGTPIRASAGGAVRFAGAAGGYGQMVEIDHGGGLTTRYGHLSRVLVRPGSAVAQGETIALMGSTGRSTGSHLHFEVRAAGRPVDPLPYLTGAPRAQARTAPAATEPALPHLSAFARARKTQRDWQDCAEVLCVAP